MISTRLVGLARIGLVAASLAFAGGASLGAGPVSAGSDDPLLTIRRDLIVRAQVPTGPQFDSRCTSLKKLAAGASAAGDPQQAHEFRQEAMGLGCL